MAARFISINDFTGFYGVNDDYYDDDIVELTEENILRDLLGDELYNAFIFDLDEGEPQSQKWIDLLNGKTYSDGFVINYKGLIEMLVAFSFYALVMDKNKSNMTGFTKNLNENSRVLNEFEKIQLANKGYNNGVNYYHQAERYINFYSTDFPNWYHKVKNYKRLIEY